MKYIAILFGKLAIILGKILKRGSSMPGSIALKIDKNLLKKFVLPKNVIAVTGSSGKGSTSSIIAHVYRKMGYKVVYNSSGANLTPGIVTTILENCTFSGKLNCDVVVFETDERFAKFIFPIIKPTHIVITNITRDQPPRQGHYDLVFEEIKKALPLGSKLILNADDPYLLKFNLNDEFKPIYYSLDKQKESFEDHKFNNLNMEYCPKCNSKLIYEYYHFETLGKYNCPMCEFSHPKSNYTITNIDFNNMLMTINNKYSINLQYDVLYSAYNTMAAFVTLCEAGLDKNEVCKYINTLEINPKMYNRYKYNSSNVYILNNKNENCSTFNHSILFTKRFNGSKTFVIGWKEISRRYAFDDLSWLYDVDFEILNDSDDNKFICVGPNAYDIAVRLKLCNIKNIETFSNLLEAKQTIDNLDSDYIFAILNFDYVEPFKENFKPKED